MRAAVDPKFDLHSRRGRLVVIDRTGGKSCTRERGQEQRGGPGLDHRAAGDLDCVGLYGGFLVVHDGSMFEKVIEGSLQEDILVTAKCLSSSWRKPPGFRPGVVRRVGHGRRRRAPHYTPPQLPISRR